jgi:thymidylate synthase (FAD)
VSTLISNHSTPNGDALMAYLARQSSDKTLVERWNDPEKLLRYCMRNGHWSVFEQAHMTLEFQVPRWLGRQLLRHRSFTFQEFSQRYQVVPNAFYPLEARIQDKKNRQNSIEVDDPELEAWWRERQREVWEEAYTAYQEALNLGLAREVAARMLPEFAPSTMVMTGNVRSWIHFLQVRSSKGTQKETRELAAVFRAELAKSFPITYEAAFAEKEGSNGNQ